VTIENGCELGVARRFFRFGLVSPARLRICPTVLKEWAYAGFAITLVSALVAHLAVGDGVEAWCWSVGTGVLWGVSYFFFRRLQSFPGLAHRI
jgi:hypothetical protein